MRQLFDDWPETYEQWFATPVGRLVKKVEEELLLDLKQPNPGDLILDAGCGTGVFTLDLLHLGCHVIGIDLSMPMLARAKQKAFCPVLDLSRGGVRFLTQKPLKFKCKVSLQLSVPGERIPLDLKRRVRWSTFNAGKSYKYQAGVQFNPYGLERGQNPPQVLTKLVGLEQKFVESDPPAEPGRTDGPVS